MTHPPVHRWATSAIAPIGNARGRRRTAVVFRYRDYCPARRQHARDSFVDPVVGRRDGGATPEAVRLQRTGRTGRRLELCAIRVGHGRPGRARTAGQREASAAAAARSRGRRPTAGRRATVPGENGERLVGAGQTDVGRHVVGRFGRRRGRPRAAQRVRPVPPSGRDQTIACIDRRGNC